MLAGFLRAALFSLFDVLGIFFRKTFLGEKAPEKRTSYGFGILTFVLLLAFLAGFITVVNGTTGGSIAPLITMLSSIAITAIIWLALIPTRKKNRKNGEAKTTTDP